MARAVRQRPHARLRTLVLNAFLAMWVGGMVVRACSVLFAPLPRLVDALALALAAALQR